MSAEPTFVSRKEINTMVKKAEQLFPVSVPEKSRKIIDDIGDCVVKSTLDGGETKTILTHLILYSKMVRDMSKDVGKDELKVIPIPFTSEIINAFLYCVFTAPTEGYKTQKSVIEGVCHSFFQVHSSHSTFLQKVADFLHIHRYFATELSFADIRPEWLFVQNEETISFLHLLFKNSFYISDFVVCSLIFQLTKILSKNHYTCYKTGQPLHKIDVKEILQLPQEISSFLIDCSFNGTVKKQDHPSLEPYFKFLEKFTTPKTHIPNIPHQHSANCPPWHSRGGN